MHIDVNLDGNLTETYFRGNSDVFIGQHKGRAVAVKMLHFYVISDREELIRASVTIRALRNLSLMRVTEIHPRSCRVETPPTPEHTAVAGGEYG